MFACAVVAVHDGDTMRCADGTRVRLQAIDAPEVGRCPRPRICAPGDPQASRRALVGLALGKTVSCTATGTSYRRITAWCEADGRDLSCAMYLGGYAIRWDKYDRDHRLCHGTP
jgi:endonuclease YncB( thermonuclease family)